MTKAEEHRWAVDSIEQGVARVEEDGARMLSVPAHLLPDGVAEGQVLRVSRTTAKGAVNISVSLDPEATAQALAKSRETMDRAMKASKKRDPGGDVSL